MSDLKKFTILVVDDEEGLRRAIEFDFKRAGFNVIAAGNGVDALMLVKEQPVHLVVSDIRMPGGDGMTLLEKIRLYNPLIPVVIFITGFADVTVEECKAKGARDVLSKPFDRKQLMQAVRDALGLPAEKAQ